MKNEIFNRFEFELDAPQPRPNENGGKYGRGVIVRTYRPGTDVNIKVNVNAHHKGYSP